MGLLASVGPNMNSEGTSLYECLMATLIAALVRPFIGVNSIVSLQVGFSIEALSTCRCIVVLPATLERARGLFGLHDFE